MNQKLAYRFAVAIALFGITTIGNVTRAGSPVYVGKQRPSLVPMSEIDHDSWNDLLKKYVDTNGMVDYRSWHRSAADQKKLDVYLGLLSSASLSPDSSTTREHRLAFWINAYNAATVKGILREYPTTSIRNHTAKLWGYNIWKDLKLYVGNQAHSLDEMEHQILRKMSEPRIHFAIVCASKGCPRLLNEAYVADRLDDQLTVNAKDFFSRRQNFRYEVSSKKFLLSSILNWFGEDFGSNQAAQLRTLSKWLPENAQSAAKSNSVRVSYLDYDWSLNAQR